LSALCDRRRVKSDQRSINQHAKTLKSRTSRINQRFFDPSIFNGVPDPAGNVLMDVPVKRPGYTHAAFIVESMADLVHWLEQEQIVITEGPVQMGQDRRIVCFIRDPDRNVLEFNEILK
ncbi:VOC family protein, partial [Gluconobacter cerinus]|uniref:VOC family protein n=1 Tax=Gluconobacter cerinus TaxID=38307 RepID=UPI002226D896